MTKNLEGRIGGCLLIVLLFTFSSVSATVFFPISDSHRSAAIEVFSPVDGSFQSLEAAYEALKTFDILGIQKSLDVTVGTCPLVEKTLGSSFSTPKDLYDALRVNGLLKCEIPDGVYEAITSRLLKAVKEATSLLDFHYSVGSLVLVKDQTSKDVLLDDAVGIFRSIKELSQSDGRWRYSSNNPESSTLAAGIALETLSGVAALSSSEIDDSLISKLEKDVTKLFDSIEKYDDGTFYFDEKVIDSQEHQGPLSTTSSVVRGITSFAAITSGSLNLPGDKIVGLAKFFLGIGTAGNAKDFFSQIDSLARLESNRISVPLILSLPSSVLSLTRNDQLKVRVNTVLGSSAPPLTVKLVGAYSTSSKAAPVIENQELKSDTESGVYLLDVLPKTVDVGNYVFTFEVLLHDPDHQKLYVTGGQSELLVFVTGVINVDNAIIDVLDTDLGSIETEKKLNLAEEKAISLSANHLQKLRFSFQLTTPLGKAFKPHQALLKLRHETKVEHIFVVKGSGKKFEILLDFLGLVDKLYYLSGRYDIELSIGDAVMENSFSRDLGSVELDLPEAPEKASRPPPQPVDPYLRYGPKAEISHIFRTPDKRPAQELSLAFVVFTLMPFLGFLVGLFLLGVNLKNFPTSAVPSAFAILFHGGIAAVLLLYVLFWLKLDLFTTLKSLGFLGVFLLIVGHRILSHLAATSSKLKSA